MDFQNLKIQLADQDVGSFAATLGDQLSIHVRGSVNLYDLNAAEVLAVLLHAMQTEEIVILSLPGILAGFSSKRAFTVFGCQYRVLHFVDLTFQRVGASLCPSFCLNQLG